MYGLHWVLSGTLYLSKSHLVLDDELYEKIYESCRHFPVVLTSIGIKMSSLYGYTSVSKTLNKSKFSLIRKIKPFFMKVGVQWNQFTSCEVVGWSLRCGTGAGVDCLPWDWAPGRSQWGCLMLLTTALTPSLSPWLFCSWVPQPSSWVTKQASSPPDQWELPLVGLLVNIHLRPMN